MKILHVAETIKGGVASVLRILLREQMKSGIRQVHCIVPDIHISELYCVDVEVTPFRSYGRSLLTQVNLGFTFTKSLFELRPDVVHLHSSFAGFVCRVILLFVRPWLRPVVIYCPHGFAFLMRVGFAKRKVYEMIEVILSYFTDQVVCVSKFEEERAIEAGIHKERISCIYNGVDEVQESGTRDACSMPGGFKLLFVGRFDTQKGFDTALKISRLLPERYHLTAIGGGVLEHVAIPDSARVTIVPWVDKKTLDEYYRGADAVIIPSRWEGFAMVPLEAMANSKPVIANRTTSLPEAVCDGGNGYLFSENNLGEIVGRITSTADEEWIRMGLDGYDRFLNEFSSSIMCASYQKLYLEEVGRVAENKKRRGTEKLQKDQG